MNADDYVLEEGETVAINWKEESLAVACCTCGLTHILSFKVKGKVLEMTPYLDKRVTAMVRRSMRKGKKK